MKGPIERNSWRFREIYIQCSFRITRKSKLTSTWLPRFELECLFVSGTKSEHPLECLGVHSGIRFRTYFSMSSNEISLELSPVLEDEHGRRDPTSILERLDELVDSPRMSREKNYVVKEINMECKKTVHRSLNTFVKHLKYFKRILITWIACWSTLLKTSVFS